jgi:hypothetical protein
MVDEKKMFSQIFDDKIFRNFFMCDWRNLDLKNLKFMIKKVNEVLKNNSFTTLTTLRDFLRWVYNMRNEEHEILDKDYFGGKHFIIDHFRDEITSYEEHKEIPNNFGNQIHSLVLEVEHYDLNNENEKVLYYKLFHENKEFVEFFEKDINKSIKKIKKVIKIFDRYYNEKFILIVFLGEVLKLYKREKKHHFPDVCNLLNNAFLEKYKSLGKIETESEMIVDEEEINKRLEGLYLKSLKNLNPKNTIFDVGEKTLEQTDLENLFRIYSNRYEIIDEFLKEKNFVLTEEEVNIIVEFFENKKYNKNRTYTYINIVFLDNSKDPFKEYNYEKNNSLENLYEKSEGDINLFLEKYLLFKDFKLTKNEIIEIILFLKYEKIYSNSFNSYKNDFGFLIKTFDLLDEMDLIFLKCNKDYYNFIFQYLKIDKTYNLIDEVKKIIIDFLNKEGFNRDAYEGKYVNKEISFLEGYNFDDKEIKLFTQDQFKDLRDYLKNSSENLEYLKNQSYVFDCQKIKKFGNEFIQEGSFFYFLDEYLHKSFYYFCIYDEILGSFNKLNLKILEVLKENKKKVFTNSKTFFLKNDGNEKTQEKKIPKNERLEKQEFKIELSTLVTKLNEKNLDEHINGGGF